MTNINELFNLKATTAPTKANLSDLREGLITELEATSVPTWAGFNAALAARNWAITPAKSLYVAAFGKERGGKAWADVEGRWALLQATSAVYVAELNDVTIGAANRSALNKKRRTALFKQVRDICAYHGIDIKRDLKPADLISLGELAIKCSFALSAGDVEARAVGTSAYIKAAIWSLLGRDSTTVALSALSQKAMTAVEKAQKGADNRLDWDEGDHPKFLLG